MGINPDAYMSGAIPGLSRGGSWQNVQDPYSSPLDPMQQGGGSIYPRPSQIVPPGSIAAPSTGMGNRSNSHFAQQHHPWAGGMLPNHQQSPLSQGFAPSYQQSYFPGMGLGSQASSTGYSGSMISGKASSVATITHLGWTNLNGQYIGSYTSAPNSPTIRSGQNTPRSVHLGLSTPRSATSPHAPSAFNPAQLQHPSSANGLSIQHQHEWEWASGSTKPMSAEPDYFGTQSPSHQEKYHKVISTQHVPPPASARIMTLRLPPKRTKVVEALPPPPQSGRLRHESMRQTQQNQRPMPQRRHTHDRFSPENHETVPSKHQSKSLGRPGKGERDTGSVVGESYYAPSKSSSMPKSRQSTLPHSPSPRAETRRTESLLSTQDRATSLTERRLKQTGRPALPTIISNSVADFTSTDPSVTQSARPHRSIFNLGELSEVLPSASVISNPEPYTASLGGYASTDEQEEDYDRYMAHPAAPTISRQEVSAPPPMRMDVKVVKPEEYRPPSFPAPTKALAWNRDGPAMKTHGVAWKRDAPEGQIPTGPAGPRWAQARPPNLVVQDRGNWWESGVG